MIGMRVILMCQMIFLGLILSGNSVQGCGPLPVSLYSKRKGCNDLEKHYCKDLTPNNCTQDKWTPIFCKKTCGLCSAKCTSDSECPKSFPYCDTICKGCERPSGWCSHNGSTYESKDCDRDGIPDHVCRDTNGYYGVIQSSKKCASSWPYGQCKGCERPSGWCSRGYESYESKDCDGDNIPDPVCREKRNHFSTRIIMSSEKCASSENMLSSSQRKNYQCKGCERPPRWCTHGGSIYESKDCDGDGIPDHVCSDRNGYYGVIQSSKKCANSWPYGQCKDFTKIERTRCNNPMYGINYNDYGYRNKNYATLAAAKIACAADSKCKGVYDPRCYDQGFVFGLCSWTSTYQNGSSECIYEKNSGHWNILLQQTMIGGPWINFGTPIPATIAFKVDDEDVWIVGAVDGAFLKMVKLRVTGPNTFNWIIAKYRPVGSYPESCLSSFSESCFVGTNTNAKNYQVQLVATRDN